MNQISLFFKEHWKIMLIGLFGVAFGVYLNWFLGIYQNRQLLSTLKEELSFFESKRQLTVEDKDHIKRLKEEIYILRFKC